MKMPQIHKYLSACYSCVVGTSTKINFLPFQELSQLFASLVASFSNNNNITPAFKLNYMYSQSSHRQVSLMLNDQV